MTGSGLALALAGAMLWARAAAVPRAGDSVPAAAPFACPVTAPNGIQPPPEVDVFGRGGGDYGNGALWTALWTWGEGEIRVDPDHVRPDGSLGPMKWPWFRSVPGPLTVEGRRLDAPAPPLQAYAGEASLAPPAATPAGAAVHYPERAFLATSIVFPSEGCWEITGRVGAASLTFVTRVVRVAPEGTPEPAAAAATWGGDPEGTDHRRPWMPGWPEASCASTAEAVRRRLGRRARVSGSGCR